MTGHDLEEFAVLKVRKSTMPPGASLVVCYDDGSGEPVLADDMYSEYVVVRQKLVATRVKANEKTEIPTELWNFINAFIWETANWTPRKRHFKKMICLKARDLRDDVNAVGLGLGGDKSRMCIVPYMKPLVIIKAAKATEEDR